MGSALGFLPSIAGYNGDGATLSVFQNPGIPNLVNEYGSATSSTRPGAYDPAWAELSSQLTNGFPTEFPWRSGQARWCMFDYGTHYGPSLGDTGIVDYFRLPKRAWYWYRNAYAHVAPPAWPSSGTPSALELTTSTTTLSAVDGTQDAFLTVTVVDAQGTPVNNDAPVTLTVTSGPGEFPTGSSITFSPPSSNPQSDIAVLDGQTATEFHTHYAGTTVVTASSPGLKSAAVTITSQGSPALVPGTTPPAPTRVYSRYMGGSLPTTSLTLALNHPTSASSTGSGTPAAANDGNTSTAWLAAAADTMAWWEVNMEAMHSVNTLEVTFPTAADYRYTIAVSTDANSWTTVVDQSQTTSTAQTQRATGRASSLALLNLGGGEQRITRPAPRRQRSWS